MTIYKKLAEIQKLKIVVEKKGENEYFGKAKYATLDDVLNKITPVLNGLNLLLLQEVSIVEGRQVLTTKIIDIDEDSKEEIMSQYNLTEMADRKGSQGLGSAITYARRYSVCTMLNVVGEPDMDGNQAIDSIALAKVMAAQNKVREHFDYISQIKSHISNQERNEAMSLLMELPEEDKNLIWLAPTKGGIFTTEERKYIMEGV